MTYPRRMITKTAFTPTGPAYNGSAPGIWRLDEVAYWIKQGVWPNANIIPDQYFPYVSLLLSTTSLGNANNNLFVDSSGAFNPISRTGNTTQGSFTPYGASWSNYFDGSGDYLTTPTDAAFGLGTGDFTIELWTFTTAYAGGASVLVDFRSGSEPSVRPDLEYGNTGTFNYRVNGSTVISGGTMPLNTWSHIALCRSSGTTRLFLNGTQIGSSYSDSNNYGSTARCQLGADDDGGPNAYFFGYMSNARVVKGTALYTTTFTPPTAPLTAISGTSLLTCQSNRFRDASTNNFTITVNGNTSVTEFSPFAPAYPGISYNQSDITNWSGYFDGSGDYLSMPSNAAFAFGTGDYTIEGWIYTTVSGTDKRITWFSDDRHNIDINISNQIFLYDGSIRTFGTIVFGAWNHFAVSRTSGTVSCYLNGVRGYNASETTNSTTRSMIIASNNAGNAPFPGYISNIRVVKGTGVYSGATITVPTTNLTAISGTSLLTLQNAAFTDNSTNNFVVTINGNTTVTGNSPFNTVGYWSNYFDGSGDYLTSTSANTANAMGTGDWTVEGWIYRTSSAADTVVFDTVGVGAASADYIRVFVNTTGTISFFRYSTAVSTTTSSIPVGSWGHFAVVRQSGAVKIYINGVQGNTTYTDTGVNYTCSASRPSLGINGYDNASNPFAGYISNIRAVKGTAVYTAAFTPPTSPLTAISGTSLLTCQNGRFIDNSTNAFAITVNGNTSVQSFDPFYTSTIASNGGSMYFDGTGDYLALQSSPSYALGSGDFILEVWVNPSIQGGHGSANNDCIIDFRPGSNGAYGTFYINNSGSAIAWFVNSANRITGSGIPNGAWSHLCVSRVSGTTRLFINGVQSGSNYTDSTNYLQTNPWIGQFNDGVGGGYFQGYMSGMRIVKGSGISAAFTPPTAPQTPTASTTLLINGMNAGAYDATAINDMETVGNAQVSTVQSKFGGSSMYFDGSGDNLFMPSATSMNFGAGNWTIECWVYVSTRTTNYPLIFGNNRGSFTTDALALTASNSDNASYNDKFVIAWGSSGWSSPSAGNSALLVANVTNSTGTWYHLAIVRDSSTSVKMFRNGTQVANATVSSGATFNWGYSGTFVGGGNWDGAQGYFNGYIDDLRVTAGVARYTANFTAPTQAFPTY